MPVGTLATVKGISTEQLARTGAQMVLSNTYHLHLQPGEAIVAAAGGLHRFMGWDGPMLTDSGGFQVFSLGDLNRIDDRGVVFRNPRDGRTIDMTPERATAIQMALGADVAMAFDQCPPYPATENDVIDACRRTHAWLERCVSAHNRADQALFGIVQGGCFPHLRRRAPGPWPPSICQASPSAASALANRWKRCTGSCGMSRPCCPPIGRDT